jgi:hypothetical protein
MTRAEVPPAPLDAATSAQIETIRVAMDNEKLSLLSRP